MTLSKKRYIYNSFAICFLFQLQLQLQPWRMPIVSQVHDLVNESFNADCKSTAKAAETSALPAAQHHINYILLVGSSSAVAMIPISHLVSKFIIIHQLILSLGICRGQLILFGINIGANVIIFNKLYIILYFICNITLRVRAFVMCSCINNRGLPAIVAPIYSLYEELVLCGIIMNDSIYCDNGYGSFLIILDLSANIIFIKLITSLYHTVNILLIKCAFVMCSIIYGNIFTVLAPIYSMFEELVLYNNNTAMIIYGCKS
mmetsp:Transcript_76309/g.68429  ORF Transcript_76309/g.68429 Transcript_76309/m.68429 type:complete len:260 (+) Transcript_76309:338-1117(+)